MKSASDRARLYITLAVVITLVAAASFLAIRDLGG